MFVVAFFCKNMIATHVVITNYSYFGFACQTIGYWILFKKSLQIKLF